MQEMDIINNTKHIKLEIIFIFFLFFIKYIPSNITCDINTNNAIKNVTFVPISNKIPIGKMIENLLIRLIILFFQS